MAKSTPHLSADTDPTLIPQSPIAETDIDTFDDDASDIIKKEVLNVIADKGQDLLRVDKFVQVRIVGATRSKVQKAIDDELVLVNGKPIKNNYKVRPDDHVIAYQYKVEGSEIIIPQNIPLDIVYEDDDVLLINKKPNIVVHPGAGNPNGTLINGVMHYLMQKNQVEEDIPRMGLVHRIDKDTSGLILFAKTTKAMVHLAAQFKAHTVKRRYNALVWGDLDENEGTIDCHLDRHERNRMQFDTYPDGSKGKHAITHYKVLEKFGYVTLVECILETGRTHQIRVHMKYIGHTLFNDYRYGGERILKGTIYTKYKQFVENCFKLLPRQALHAKTLGFVHPTTGAEMHFESELPADIQQVIDKWRGYVKGRSID
jgi:23S rRNA pseudouridine1911/1915/1917 synthase